MSEATPAPAPEGLGAPIVPDGAAAPPLPRQPSVFARFAALKRLHRQFWIGLVAGLAIGILGSLAVAGIGSLVATATASHVIGDAVKACGVDGKAGFAVGDGGQSVTIHTQGKTDTSGASIDDAACVLKALKVPDSVVSQIDSTTALQGRQSADWDNLNASWSYHPDSGLNLIVKVASK